MVRRFMDNVSLPEESLPRQSIVELLGDGRVLIEHHKGVLEYGTERIGVRVGFGIVDVIGCNLRLGLISCEKLVIFGQIASINLIRRKC